MTFNEIKNEKITYRGVTDTVGRICQLYHYNLRYVVDMMLKGASFEEAVSSKLSEAQKKKEQFTYKGETGTLRFFSRKYRIFLNDISNRLNSGEETFEEVMDFLVSLSPVTSHEYKGYFGNLDDICKRFGINYHAVCVMADNGFSIQEALDRAPRKKEDNIYKFGDTKGTLSQVIRRYFPSDEEYRKQYNNVRQRLKMGYSIEDAIIRSLISTDKLQVKYHCGNKLCKGTVSQIAELFNLNHRELLRCYFKTNNMDYAIFSTKNKN